MRVALIVALLLALTVQAPVGARAQGCSELDSHGRCLVCAWSYDDFTLRPGEVAQPFSCGDMARDPRATLVIGGTGTYLGPDDGALDHRIGLRIGGRRYALRRVWGPNTATMPVGPIWVPLGPVADHGVVTPSLKLIACHARFGGSSACHFNLSGRICLSNMC